MKHETVLKQQTISGTQAATWKILRKIRLPDVSGGEEQPLLHPYNMALLFQNSKLTVEINVRSVKNVLKKCLNLSKQILKDFQPHIFTCDKKLYHKLICQDTKAVRSAVKNCPLPILNYYQGS